MSKIKSFFLKLFGKKKFILTEAVEEKKDVSINIKKEELILKIIETLFDAALINFSGFASVGVVLDDKEQDGYLAHLGFTISPESDPIFITIPIKRIDNIEDEELQKSIYEKFISTMSEARKKDWALLRSVGGAI